MYWMHPLLELAATLGGSLGAPRGFAWIIALFGNEQYSERAMRLLRRPPLRGKRLLRANRRHAGFLAA